MADVGPSSGSEPGPSHASNAGEEGTGSEGSKKVRKTYTITKQRENWTTHEHQKFLEAVELYDRDWKKIEAYVGTKTVIQVRTNPNVIAALSVSYVKDKPSIARETR
mmetsp:Transcript_987/g.6184  ORF Transcript_987/g.6184 Transcript_987/m.6184 type:complete len:107 (-) Transcript_987:1517-1837(-)